MNEAIFKERNFVIAEILACVSFILNTICVITAKELHGPGAPSWLPHFGFIYWSKTILAVIGLFYFFTSRVFTIKSITRYFAILTLILLWFSIPLINSILTLHLDALFTGLDVARKQGVTFESRIPTQIVWSIPMFIVMVDLLRRSTIKIKLKSKNV